MDGVLSNQQRWYSHNATLNSANESSYILLICSTTGSLGACRTKAIVTWRVGERGPIGAHSRRIVGLFDDDARRYGPLSRRRSRFGLSSTGFHGT